MDYQYDIFISYRRDDLTLKWIETHLVPLLKLHIKMELGREPTIFIDSTLEQGSTWPIELGSALGRSRLIIPLWTKTYLGSVWCTHEISHMIEREKKCGFRTYQKPTGLIFPTIIHDGETLPLYLTTIQKTEIQECFNVRMSIDSPKAEVLDDKLRLMSITIAEAINAAPDWEEDWNLDAVDRLVQELHEQSHHQNQFPKFTS
nr:TIR domain-containing protein [uncultured Chryseobacterium sp.]